jgi:hypothetical protein
MTSDSDETSTTRSPVILLDGHDNYKEWLRYVRNILHGKDLYDVADGTDPYPSARISSTSRRGRSRIRRRTA